MQEKKLFLLDAFALIFRAYYALVRSPRITSQGKNTNAQFGFTNTLIDLINNQKPSHLAVCFDTKATTTRKEKYEAYKANRQETPPDILQAVPDIKKILQAFNIPIVEVDGFEADDVIGTLSVKAAKEGYQVFMVTPDKDYGQLVTENVFMYKPPYQGGKFEVMGIKEILEKWDIERIDQVIDMLGLMGDASDNIPGIKGVGEKTAVKFLKQYGSLENILANADDIKGSIGEKVRAGKEDALLSKDLATIILDVPCEFHEENFKISEWDKEKLEEIFNELEFRTLGKRLLGDTFQVTAAAGEQSDLFGNAVAQTISAVPQKNIELNFEASNFNTIENTAHEYKKIAEGEIDNFIEKLKSEKEICFDTETTGVDANLCELVGLSFSLKKGEAFYISCPDNKTDCILLLKKFEHLFNDEQKIWIGQNIKYDLLVLKNYGFEFAGEIFDTMLAHYVIEPEGKSSMDELSKKYLNYAPVSIEELIGKKGKGQGNMRDVEDEKITAYAAEDADITFQLKETFVPLLKENEVEKVFNEVENPLAKVLVDMEFEGIKIDEGFLLDYGKELAIEAKSFEESVYDQAGVRFNLASPKQLGEVLFDKLKLDEKAKKTKTGQYKTGEDVLQKLAPKHKICDDILAFRQLTKLKNTYVDTLPQLINPNTGRVHTNYAQTVAVTGRLSSNNPNLQNIPIRSERGKEIRKAFISRDENYILISADYSQIELRIIAAISGDENMCAAFKAGKDIHTATAAKVFGIEENEVSKEQRYKAKSVNFGIIYGQGAFGLADNLGISRTEAKEIIDNYKKEFNGISLFMEETIASARKNGFVETLMGRKRWLKEINSSNFTERAFAERNAINSPIQGSAADMIKMAMIKIHQEMKSKKMISKMLLQVHDELIFDAHIDEIDELKILIIENMENAMPLPNDVPVIAEMGAGRNWLEAH